MSDTRGFGQAMIGDGRPLFTFAGLILILCGGFALFQSATGHFLPHDVEYLGMTARDLCALHQCRVVHFMFHDRVSFGGTLIAIGALYCWLAEFPLRAGQAWAWWLFLASGLTGFGSFLAYLGFGYLDRWHAAATLVLLPCYGWGLWRTAALVHGRGGLASLLRPATGAPPWRSRAGIGRFCLLAAALGLVGAGLTITVVGMTTVFVPQDLTFMGLAPADLRAISPRLIPLIAHDRAGFGGGVCTAGVLIFFCAWCGQPSRGQWQALCLAGLAGFVTAIGIHPLIGYTDPVHLAPAVLGATAYALGLALSFRPAHPTGNMLPTAARSPERVTAVAAAQPRETS